MHMIPGSEATPTVPFGVISDVQETAARPVQRIARQRNGWSGRYAEHSHSTYADGVSVTKEPTKPARPPRLFASGSLAPGRPNGHILADVRTWEAAERDSSSACRRTSTVENPVHC